jgi:hypothetical protein
VTTGSGRARSFTFALFSLYFRYVIYAQIAIERCYLRGVTRFGRLDIDIGDFCAQQVIHQYPASGRRAGNCEIWWVLCAGTTVTVTVTGAVTVAEVGYWG